MGDIVQIFLVAKLPLNIVIFRYPDVTYAATVLMKRKRFRTPKLLPFTEDVMKVR